MPIFHEKHYILSLFRLKNKPVSQINSHVHLLAYHMPEIDGTFSHKYSSHLHRDYCFKL